MTDGGLQSLFDANEGDAVFTCGPLNKKVHSLLLGAQSKLFDTMLTVAFQEGQGKRFELPQQDPYLAIRMLQHLYGISYSGHKVSIGDEEEPFHISELHTHASMYALGDEYGIMDLKEEALGKFKTTIEAKKGHKDELESVLKVIPTVYKTTPSSDRGLRDAVVAFGANNLKQIKDLSGFESAMTQAPAYMVEVLPMFLQRLEDEQRRHSALCLHCYDAREWILDRRRCYGCRSSTTLEE